MTTPARGFDDAEFAARCTSAQAAMTRADVGALLLTSEAEIRYFTGFMTPFWQSPTRPWFVVIHHQQTYCYHSIDWCPADATMFHRKHH